MPTNKPTNVISSGVQEERSVSSLALVIDLQIVRYAALGRYPLSLQPRSASSDVAVIDTFSRHFPL